MFLKSSAGLAGEAVLARFGSDGRAASVGLARSDVRPVICAAPFQCGPRQLSLVFTAGARPSFPCVMRHGVQRWGSQVSGADGVAVVQLLPLCLTGQGGRIGDGEVPARGLSPGGTLRHHGRGQCVQTEPRPERRAVLYPACGQ